MPELRRVWMIVFMTTLLLVSPFWADARGADVGLTDEERAWLAANPDRLVLWYEKTFPRRALATLKPYFRKAGFALLPPNPIPVPRNCPKGILFPLALPPCLTSAFCSRAAWQGLSAWNTSAYLASGTPMKRPLSAL